MIAALTPKIVSADITLNTKTLVSVMQAFTYLGESLEVRKLYVALIPKIKQCTGFCDSGGVSSIMFAFHGMSDCPETREFVSALTSMVHRVGLRGGGGVGMGVSGMVFVGLVLGCIEAKFCK